MEEGSHLHGIEVGTISPAASCKRAIKKTGELPIDQEDPRLAALDRFVIVRRKPSVGAVALQEIDRILYLAQIVPVHLQVALLQLERRRHRHLGQDAYEQWPGVRGQASAYAGRKLLQIHFALRVDDGSHAGFALRFGDLL
uniref:Uncharacterized protein n=1 Tax=Anopheles coluzzii TaxID=1518534 RepID=A0A8W7P8I6_ANOCL